MKLIRIAFAAVAALAFNSAYAFHAGGVAECNGCHTMHNSYEGESTSPNLTHLAAGPYLLKGNDQSSACLNCHATARTAPGSYYVLDTDRANSVASPGAPDGLSPGGDFGWLSITNSWNGGGGAFEQIVGERKGHNTVAADFSISADSVLTVAPGGTYPAADLSCISCHDPHGKFRRNADGSITTTGAPIRGSGSYNTSPDPTLAGAAGGSTVSDLAVGVYRILGGAGYTPMSTGYAFVNQVPAAVTPSTYNRTEAVTQTVTAYGSGMAEWCANCHGAMHMSSYVSASPGLVHPAGNGAKLTAAIATNYNNYVRTGTLAAGNNYSSLVPFEMGIGTTHSVADYTTLKSTSGNGAVGPTAVAGTSNVSCLSCHRAHASAFDSMLRWSLHYEFMTNIDAAGATVYGNGAAGAANNRFSQGYTAAQYQQAMYGRPATQFAPFQRVLCNKCHVKD